MASQELEPGHGWDYRALQVLADEPHATADELGEAIIAGFSGQAEEQGDPEGVIVPDVLTVTADGEQVWEPTTDVGLYSDIAGLTYDFVPLDPARASRPTLSIYDVGGNVSTLSSLVEVP